MPGHPRKKKPKGRKYQNNEIKMEKPKNHMNGNLTYIE